MSMELSHKILTPMGHEASKPKMSRSLILSYLSCHPKDQREQLERITDTYIHSGYTISYSLLDLREKGLDSCVYCCIDCCEGTPMKRNA